jgi:hypothetical protein
MKKIIFILFVIAITAGGCRKNFDVNQYTNQPADVLPNLLLYAGLSKTASNNATNYLGLTRWMGYWARSGDYPPDVQTEAYDIENSYSDSEWIRLYQNLGTYDLLEKTARDLGQPFYIGAAKVMKAYCFSTLVDIYNDVPYKEAFGATTRNHPVYDNGQNIYNDLIIQLDSAIIYFENARLYYQNHIAGIAIADDQYDIMFGSAKSKAAGYNERLTLWEKLTNTLELKLLMHQSQIGAQRGFIENKINSIATSRERKAAGFIGAGESATVNAGYHASPGKMNPFYDLFFLEKNFLKPNSDYYTANAYVSNFYESGNDIRENFFNRNDVSDFIFSSFFGMPGDSALLIGFDSNDTIFIYYFEANKVVAVLNGDTLHPNDFGGNYDGDPYARSSFFSERLDFYNGYGLLKAPEQDQFIFSDFESLFLQAEAVQRHFLIGNAQTLYESAITRNFIYLQSPFSAVDAIAYAQQYFTQNIKDVGWAASLNNELEAILTQKWAAMNGVNWVEAYTDYRRTGYPTSNVLGISHAPTHLQPMIPIRFLYPQSQLNNNGANVPQLGANAQFTAKVFWDQ